MQKLPILKILIERGSELMTHPSKIIIIIITGFIYSRYLPFQALPDSDREKKIYKSIKVAQLKIKNVIEIQQHAMA